MRLNLSKAKAFPEIKHYVTMETSSNNMDKNQIDFFTCAAFHVLLGNFEKKTFQTVEEECT